jgi:hypothetical protein
MIKKTCKSEIPSTASCVGDDESVVSAAPDPISSRGSGGDMRGSVSGKKPKRWYMTASSPLCGGGTPSVMTMVFFSDDASFKARGEKRKRKGARNSNINASSAFVEPPIDVKAEERPISLQNSKKEDLDEEFWS